ncbi:protein arginine kinase activator [Haloferula luteola]|uniref:Protein arginine kinase activator n=1 Tax=Haloferula luteola TaxID=595692 RepID=A0A840V462_9BACT|nr:UvrB/UvrC motif-containing protein [Haloferula luteola]MBB5352323.1 protein arginine kinase activator [Haloferula luteola]
MDCDKCGKPAKVHLTQLVGGQVKKIALCNECAKESGVTDPAGFALADLLLAPGASASAPASAPLAPRPPTSGRQCPECGFTLEDLQRVRRFGCGTCYETFRHEVDQMIRGMHKGPEHRGKVPDGLYEQQQRRQRLEELRNRLEAAVEAENYEEAAGLRDQIRELEGSSPEAEKQS